MDVGFSEFLTYIKKIAAYIQGISWPVKTVIRSIGFYFFVYKLHLFLTRRWQKYSNFLKNSKLLSRLSETPFMIPAILTFLYLSYSILAFFSDEFEYMKNQRKEMLNDYEKLYKLKAELYGIVNSSLVKTQAIKEVSKVEEYLWELYYYLIDYPKPVLGPSASKKYNEWRIRNFKGLVNYDFPDKKNLCYQKYYELRKWRHKLGNVPTVEIRLENLAQSKDCENSFLIHFTLSEVLKQIGKKKRDKSYLLRALEEVKKALNIAYDKGLKGKKEIVPILHSYAEINLLLGNLNEGEMILRETVKLYPFHPKANSQLSEINELQNILKLINFLAKMKKDLVVIESLIRSENLINGSK